MYVSILSTTFVRKIYNSKKNKTSYDYKCVLLFMSDFNKTRTPSKDFRKILKL
jgi:hypothetical protein